MLRFKALEIKIDPTPDPNFNPPLESLILRKRSSSPEDWYLEKIPFNSPNDLG